MVTLFVFWQNFKDYPLSNSTEDWGAFGSYLSGLIAPIFSFFTLVLLIIQQNQNRKSISEIQHEKIIGNYLDLLQKAELQLNKYEKKALKYLPPNCKRIDAIENPKDHGEFQIIWKLVESLKLYYRFKQKITYLEPEHPINDYFIQRYGELAVLLEGLKYIDIKRIYL
ncbi:hypothetical protein [Spirochaeta lutea]|nr:hypothetical protein [Spirochaeta lutea]